MNINWQEIITGIVTVSVITYFIRKSLYAAQAGELKFGLFMKGLGLVCLLFSVGPFLALVTENYQVQKPGETTALIGLTVGFGIAAAYTLAEAFFVKGTYNETLIQFSTPWTGRKFEKWDDLESVDFNGWCYWYVLKFKSGKVVRLSSYLGGRGFLLERLQDRGYDL